ncbi:MAG: hypothetical protein EZS28_038349 [Streblomastix strix]|uniref:HECT-type E3 ubiquitin transferase n=1 Tax=Streblomastix strix TaxID=222440 RepID=A0A5J4U8V1_9EUKA|nr:MAG: hypothetical protein EZS28_038349 [Streblomastix strix]
MSYNEFTPPVVNGECTSESSLISYVQNLKLIWKKIKRSKESEGKKGLISMSALEDAFVGTVQDMKARVNYYNKIITQLIHPLYNLFIAVKPAEDMDPNTIFKNVLVISHTAYLSQDQNFSPKLWLQFLGVILAESIVNNVTIHATPFSPFIFKALLAIPPNVADLEDVEPNLAQQLRDLREQIFNEDSESRVDLNFEHGGVDYRFMIYTRDMDGDERNIELVHGGLHLKVTRENFDDFEALCANIGLLWNRAELLQALCIGFWSILPVRLLRMLQFNHEELKQMIFG